MKSMSSVHLSTPSKPSTTRNQSGTERLSRHSFHFRVLRGFFFSEGHRNGDVYASHYVGKWPHTPFELDPTRQQSVFARTKASIDKRLAHLTTERLKPHL